MATEYPEKQEMKGAVEMANKEITLRCKNCGREFSYSEEAYKLMAEKGESRIDRCEECLQSHGKEIRDTESPYFKLRKKTNLPLNFDLTDDEFSFRGERIPQEEEKIGDSSGMDISITDEDVITLYRLLENNQVVVMVSPTGTGKSTYIPKRLVEAPESYSGDFVERLIRQGQIIITQPRILATQQTANTTAKISGSNVGPTGLFGFRHSAEDLSGRWNKAISITDGTLPNWIREGKLGQYSLIMVDEAHERSCNIDLILGFLKRELPKYPQLRVIISSATINTQKFLDAFKEMNISVELLDIPSRKKFRKYEHWWKDENPVQGCDCWLCRKSEKERRSFWKAQKDIIKQYDLPEVATNFALKILNETDEGSILIFLHGENPIKETVKKIKARCKRDIEVIPAYRQIQRQTEEELKRTEGKRRVIVATNIAETSLTIPDLVYEINSGWIKQIKWDPETQIQKLQSKFHSRDGIKQRDGRVGRNQNGYAYRLFTEKQWNEELEEHTSPEITSRCLDDSLVTLKAAGIVEAEQFPWMEKPTEWSEMDKEIKRAQQSLKDRGVVDQKGEIVERALELLGIPRSSTETSLLFSADEQGLLFETMAVLMLMSTRDGESRTGANLYNPYFGLLLWNEEWTAKTKARVDRIHQGLKVGCQDDLDFVIKLAYCFWKTERNGLSEKWAKYHFLNYGNLQGVLSEINELIAETFGEEREESIRDMDLDSLDKIRLLMTSTWLDRVVSLESGTVSLQCVGSWQERKKALAMTLIEEGVVIDGYPQRVPRASFMVNLPGKVSRERRDLFIDQRFPISSWVKVKEERGKIFIVELIAVPEPIKVNYRKTLWLKEESKKEETINFDERFIDWPKDETLPIEGVWIEKSKTDRAKIVGWIEKDGQPVAVLSPFADSDIVAAVGQKGDALKVKIHQVIRDPVGKGGWILVRTENGIDLTVELEEMSLSPIGYGLEQIKGKTLNLAIKDFDKDGYPILSNIEQLIEDLKKLREEISESEKATKVSQRNFIDLSGFVVEIDEEEEKAIIVIIRGEGIIHSFEVSQTYVPGGDLRNLRINEEIVIRLFNRTNDDEISVEYFTEKEINSRPRSWRLNEAGDKALVPLCLEDKDIERWDVRPELIDFVKRHSWQYCLQARIVSLKERLSKLNEEDLVEGVIQQIDYEEDRETIKAVQVIIDGNIPGFAFGSDLGSLSVLEGDRISFYIKAVDPNSGFLRLIDSKVEVQQTKEYIERCQNNILKAKVVIKGLKEAIEKREANIAKLRRWISDPRCSRLKAEEYERYIAENNSEIISIRSKIKAIDDSIRRWEEKKSSAKKKLDDNEI